MKEKTICLFGAASDTIDDIYIHEGEKLGQEIGQRGHTLIYGGGATGLMGACARGVASAGGKVIGVVPTFMDVRQELNEKCDQLIRTDTMHERKHLMEVKADAFIVTPGGVGTMDEFFEVLTLVQLQRLAHPIIIYNTNGYYDELIHFIDSCIQKKFISITVKDFFRVCHTPAETLDMIEYFA